MKISVIMPVYNSGEYLDIAVQSILSQSLKEFELILVDDGSTDGSSQKCDKYAIIDNRVVVIHQKNGGICNARNTALKIARGEYIAFSDHDDEYFPGLLEENYKIAKKENLDFVKFCKRQDVIKKQKIISSSTNSFHAGIYTRDDLRKMLYSLYFNSFCTTIWDGLYRRDFLCAHNLKFNEFFKKGYEDLDFFAHILMHVQRYGINNKCYYLHNLRLSFSTSLQKNPFLIQCHRSIVENFIEILKSLDLSPKDNPQLYTLFFYKIYLVHVIIELNHQEIAWNEKVMTLNRIKEEPVFYDFMRDTSLPLLTFKHYYFLHRLYINNHYSLILMIYKGISKLRLMK